METFERIKHLRKDTLKLSQAQFGEKLGVSRDVVKNIEGNLLKKPEQKEPLYRLIAERFGVNLAWLKCESDEMYLPMNRKEQIAAYVSKIIKGDNDFQMALIEFVATRSPDEIECLKKSFEDLAAIIQTK